ncbi:MAG: DUF115 domain-containing protein [Nitrosopumilus sp. (ex Thoosa mismalolli)]|nr:DUF115 domain-containing protein [Nitrosopumilus sp. (ex Thoosa mismalolli)]
MIISGWKTKYAEILKEFKYSERKDIESAIYLDSVIKESNNYEKISKKIGKQNVIVIGSGPSLSRCIPKLKKMKETIKIVADSALKPLLENKIIPDIVVTDLDGDIESLKKIGKTKCIMVVHAHGDNKEKLDMVKNFKNCVGTTQSKKHNKIRNFGGFTDGDRCVFLANHFCAKKIILFGMDFGKKIGRYSLTKKSDRKIKLKKLKKGEKLLIWLSSFTKSELFTVSRPINGFKKISLSEVDIIIT